MVAATYSCCHEHVINPHNPTCPNYLRNKLVAIKHNGSPHADQDCRWLANKLLEIMDKYCPQEYDED